MPDLRRRPARYATATVVVAVLGATAWSEVDVQIGSAKALASARAENSALKKQLKDAQSRPPEQIRLPAVTRAAKVPTKTCAAYPNQQAAQAVFRAARLRHQAWDGDRDGRACEQLKSAIRPAVDKPAAARPGQILAASLPNPVVTVPPLAKPVAPTKAQILASRRHFGLHTVTTAEADGLEVSLAREATIRAYFTGFDTGFNADKVNAAWRAGQIPLLTWESRPLSNDDLRTDFSLASIVAGTHDSYLRGYASAIKANGLPLIIRFDQEMNGDWYRWSESNPYFGNAKGSYIAAWRHVYDIFAAAGANAQVIWLWGPNRVDNIKRLPGIDNYFPGAAYVDWVGMSGYYRPGDKSVTFQSTYDMTLNSLRAIAPGKPILIAEVGATEYGGKKVAFVTDFFAGLTRNPDVLGFVWFNETVTDEGQTNDWRIQSTPSVLAAFRAGLYSSGFGLDYGRRPRW